MDSSARLSASVMLGLAALALGWSWASVRGGLLGELTRGWCPEAGPGPVALWVSDRDAGAVVGLDAQALVSARFAVPSPTALVARRDGQLWVVCALEGEPRGMHELWLLAQGGRTRLRHPIGPVLDLALSGDAAALTLERAAGQAPRVARIGSSGLECDLGSQPGACCIAADARGWSLVGTEAGEVLAFAPSGPGEFPRLAAQRAFGSATLERADDLAGGRAAPLRRSAAESLVLDLAAGPRTGSWWALVRLSGRGWVETRVLLLGDDLEVRWSASSDGSATTLITAPGQSGVWLVCSDGRGVRRLGPRGTVGVPWKELSMLATGPGAGWPDGGAALVTPGAVLVLDAEGRARPGQGGFDFLVAASAVRPAGPGPAAAPRLPPAPTGLPSGPRGRGLQGARDP